MSSRESIRDDVSSHYGEEARYHDDEFAVDDDMDDLESTGVTCAGPCPSAPSSLLSLPPEIWSRVFVYLDSVPAPLARLAPHDLPVTGVLLDAMFHRLKYNAAIKRQPPKRDVESDYVRLAKWRLTGRPLSSPLHPKPFRRHAESAAMLSRKIERQYKLILDFDDDTSADDRDAGHSALTQLLEKRQQSLDAAFGLFASAIGARRSDPALEGSPLRFDKSCADAALEHAIGSANRDGNGIFKWPGLQDIDFSTDNGAARGYSLYLGRKGFSNVDPRLADSETLAFYERVCNPPPDLSPPSSRRQMRLLSLLRRLSIALFSASPLHIRRYRAPNSGKSCLERSRSTGGKRQALYLDQLEGDKNAPVRADTILSAGKLRTITVSSVYFAQYAWLNEFMFSRLRKCRWMISGRTVEDWARDVFGDLDSLPEGWIFSSGDGKCCTDYFDGRFAETVLRFLAKQFSLPLDDLLSITTKAKFETKDGIKDQLRGQLMGSDFSFPILCLVTLLGHLEASGLTDTWLRMSNRQLRETVLSYDGCGVNGDDLVDWGPSRPLTDPPSAHSSASLAPSLPTPLARWLAAFPLVGGVASPAKSPQHPEFFTVNSQLWVWRRQPGARPHNVGSVLPAMLLGILGKAHLAPAESWLDLLSSPLLPPASLDLFELDLVLLPDVPRFFGGLSLLPPDTSQPILTSRRLLWALHSRRRNWHDLAESDSGEIVVTKRSVTVLEELDEDVPPRTAMFSGFVRVAAKKRVAIARFGSPKALRWSNPNGRVPSPSSVRKYINCYFRKVDARTLALVQDYSAMESFCRRAREHFDAERIGYAFVRNASTDDFPSEDVLGGDGGRKLPIRVFDCHEIETLDAEVTRVTSYLDGKINFTQKLRSSRRASARRFNPFISS